MNNKKVKCPSILAFERCRCEEYQPVKGKIIIGEVVKNESKEEKEK